MPQASTLQVALPEDVLDFVHAKVANGEYASESDVVLQGIAALQDKDAGFESWAREVAITAYQLLVADPSRGITLDRVRSSFEFMRTKS